MIIELDVISSSKSKILSYTFKLQIVLQMSPFPLLPSPTSFTQTTLGLHFWLHFNEFIWSRS